MDDRKLSPTGLPTQTPRFNRGLKAMLEVDADGPALTANTDAPL